MQDLRLPAPWWTATLPLVASLLVVPPLCGPDRAPGWAAPLAVLHKAVLALVSETFLRDHFVFTRRGYTNGRWWTAVTYMLTHADYGHLLSNLLGLVVGLRWARLTLAAWQAWVIFIGGGVAGILCAPANKRSQVGRMLEAQTRVGEGWGVVGEWINSAAGIAAAQAAPVVERLIPYVGCSAGLCAFTGSFAAHCVLRIREEYLLTGEVPFSVARDAVEPLLWFYYCARDAVDPAWRAAGSEGPMTDSVAHLVGFFFGVVFQLGTQWYRRRRFRSGGERGGRRLGGQPMWGHQWD